MRTVHILIYIHEKNYGNSAIEAASYKGKLYGYPVTFDVPFLVYNKTAASSVETFSQLIDYCHNYTVNDDNQNIEQLVSWDVSDMLVNYGLVCGFGYNRWRKRR